MIEIITDGSLLSQLKPSWDTLADLRENPLLRFDWYASCAETIHAGHELRIVTVRRDGDLVAIAPLYLTTSHGFPTLELMGASVLYEPTGFLYADQDSLNQLLHAVIGLGIPLVLLRMPDDAILLANLVAIRWRLGIVLHKTTAPSAFLRLPKEWDVYFGSLSSSVRYDYRRKRRRLEKLGKVKTRITTPSFQEFPKLLQDALLIEDRSWKGREGSSLLRNPKLRQFFSSYLSKACKEGILRLCYIDLDGVPISMHIAIQSHQVFWVLKLGYDESLSKCSPGGQLAMDTIQYSVRQGLERYEFLGSEESWQTAWPIERHTFFSVLVYPYSLRGLLGLLGFTIAFAWKRILLVFNKTHSTTRF